MATLYELIQELYEAAIEQSDSGKVSCVKFLCHKQYGNTHRVIHIVGKYHPGSQNLWQVQVNLDDCLTERVFTAEEIVSITDNIDNPLYLNIRCYTPGSHLLEPDFQLFLFTFKSLKFSRFKAINEGDSKIIDLKPMGDEKFGVVDYDEIADMFGINLKGKQKYWKLGLGRIDSSKLPDACKWAYSKGYSLRVVLWNQGERKVQFNRQIYSEVSVLNRICLIDGIPELSGKRNGMTSQQIDAIETKIRGYRETDIDQMNIKLQYFKELS